MINWHCSANLQLRIGPVYSSTLDPIPLRLTRRSSPDLFVCFSSFLFLSCIICGRDDRPRDKERARVTKNILAGSGLPGLTRAGRTDPGSAAAHSLTLSFTCYYFARLPRPLVHSTAVFHFGALFMPQLNSTLAQRSSSEISQLFSPRSESDHRCASFYPISLNLRDALSLSSVLLSSFPADYRPDKSICFL